MGSKSNDFAYLVRGQEGLVWCKSQIKTLNPEPLTAQGGRDPNDMSTMVLVDQGIVYDRSDAVLRIGQSLNLPANGQWAALAARIAVPKPIRDWFYSDVISANRVSALASFAPNLDP